MQESMSKITEISCAIPKPCLSFYTQTQVISKEKEDSLHDYTERKQRANEVTDFLIVIATYFL